MLEMRQLGRSLARRCLVVLAYCLVTMNGAHNTNWRKGEVIPHDAIDNSKAGTHNEITQRTILSNGREVLKWWDESAWTMPRQSNKVGDTGTSFLGPAPTPNGSEGMFPTYWHDYPVGNARDKPPTQWPPSYNESKPNQWNNIDFGAALKPVDMSLKLHYGIQYVGQYLMAGSFAGDLIAQATFEANFINDVSSALEIHDSRIQVINISMGTFHHSWMNKMGAHSSVAGKGAWRVETPGDARQTSTYGRYKQFDPVNTDRDHDDGEYFGDEFKAGSWDMHPHYKNAADKTVVPEYDLDSHDVAEYPQQGFVTSFEGDYTTHSYTGPPAANQDYVADTYQQDVRDREREKFQEHEEHRLEGAVYQGSSVVILGTGDATIDGKTGRLTEITPYPHRLDVTGATSYKVELDDTKDVKTISGAKLSKREDLIGGVNPSWWQGGLTEFGAMGLGERSMPYEHVQETPNVIVHFRLLPATEHDPKSTVLAVRDLTAQVQNSTSRLYDGHVTFQTLPDSTWGLKIKHWDSSLRLSYSHKVVGELNSVNRRHFEYYFVDDMATALDISHHRVQVLFITPGDKDTRHHGSVVVKFRIYPPEYTLLMENSTTAGERQDWAPQASNGTDWGTGFVSAGRAVAGDKENYSPEPASQTREHMLSTNTSTEPRKDGWGVWGYTQTSAGDECAIIECYDRLALQLDDSSSPLYLGNVTQRTDRAYGIAGPWGMKRRAATARKHGPPGYMVRDTSSAHWSLGGDHPDDGAGRAKEYRNRPWTSDSYVRCKKTQRCPRAWGAYHTLSYQYNFTSQAYTFGRHRQIALFSEFENWRAGTHGWTWRGQPAIPTPYAHTALGSGGMHAPEAKGNRPRGAHFSTFDFDINHWKPEYSDNKGLVLNAMHQRKQVADKTRIIAEIQAEIDFLEEYIKGARDGINGDFLGRHPLSGEAFYQADHPHDLDRIRVRYKRDEKIRLRDHEMLELDILHNSQCTNLDCTLLFNTSSLWLTGVVEAKGFLAKTEAGTEVAVWNFETIELGPEVNVTIVGTRAIVLLSRSSLTLNTTLHSYPGSLGGFPGGGEIFHDDSPVGLTGGCDDSSVDPSQHCTALRYPGYKAPHTLPQQEQHRTLPDGTVQKGYPGYGNTSAWMHSDPANSTWGHTADVEAYPPIPDAGGSPDYGKTEQVHRPKTVNTQYWRNYLGVHSSSKSNVNGPGSGNVRVYQHTVSSTGTRVDEVQTITTEAQDEQTLGGCFVLHFVGHCHRGDWGTCTFPEERTQCIPHDASADEVRGYIEGGMPRVGRVHVRREAHQKASFTGGYVWTVIFHTAVGNLAQMTVTNRLTGMKAAVAVVTTQEGNSVVGDFTLAFLGNTTRSLPYNVEGPAMADAMVSDLHAVLDAMVVRTDPTSLCDHGLCDNGPDLAGGYTWTIILTTMFGNKSPTSPTSAEYNTVPVAAPLIVNSNLVGSNGGAGAASIVVNNGHSETHVLHLATIQYGNAEIPYGLSLQTETVAYMRNMMASHSRRCRAISSQIDDARCEQLCFLEKSICPRDHCRCDRTHTFYSDNEHVFSMAFGGMGGGFGGRGGVGHGKNAPGQAYGDSAQFDLLGGSGGAIGGERPFEIRPFPDPIGKGGGGGGAIELVAANDLVVGSRGQIRVDGESGHQGHRAGGGGAGGAIVLAAGGVLVHEGKLTANGGRGGHGRGDMNRGGGGGGGGRVSLYADSITQSEGTVQALGAAAGNCDFPYISCGGKGADGSKLSRSNFGEQIHFLVDRPASAPGVGRGAAQTNHSLLLYGREEITTPSGVTLQAPFPWDGPEHALERARPERVSFYVRFGETYTGGKDGVEDVPEARASDATTKRGWDTQFVLHGDPALDRSFPDGHEFPRQSPHSALLGISIMDGQFRHDANFVDTPGADTYDHDHEHHPRRGAMGAAGGNEADTRGTGGVFERNLRSRSWYKVDVFITWRFNSSELHSYDVRLNDILKVKGASFNGSYFTKLGLYKRHDAGAVRYDEIYLGYDDTMRFQCPTTAGDGVHIERPVQKGWGVEALGEETSYHPMSRHESHVSRRKKYQHNNGGLIEGDGYEHRKFHSDIRTKTPDGDHHAVKGGVYAGALTYVPREGQGRHTRGSRVHYEIMRNSGSRAAPDARTEWSSDGADDGRARQAAGERTGEGQAWGFTGDGDPDEGTGVYYWYGDHEYEQPTFAASEVDEGLVDAGGAGHGAVMACSTTDFITWKNEGTMLRFANLTDMVQGRHSGPGSSKAFVAQQPKVLYNNVTGRYVMWLQVDDHNSSLGLAGVAVSEHVNGPFELVRTFYPDGNETHDQTIFVDPRDGVTAYLARTYYMEIEYIMPEPQMQPMWESVKFPEGHVNQQSSFTFDGSVNFGLNYHRAKYHIGYDDFHDIYIQRWRNEDNKWEVVCVNSVGSQRSILIPGQYADVEKTVYQSNVCNKGNDIINSKYITTNERKIIVGQGDTGSTSLRGPVLSRFKDPTDPMNNFWKPGSVPRVKAQPWGHNYIDGECGRRDFTQGMSRLDADLPYRDLSRRDKCTNIVDNAVHATTPDMLVGVPVVVETRRAKYVAISRLTADYLDTSGVTVSFEGELEDEADLLTLMQARGQFGWATGDEVKTTFHDQVQDPEFGMEPDWDDRFYQYQDNYNDRAADSPSCINNGECPVNFAEQVRQPIYKRPPQIKKGVRP